MKIILDCNIYDRLQVEQSLTCLLRSLIERQLLTVLVTPSLWRELLASPHADLANTLPVVHIGESVFLAGGQVGDRVGSGALFQEHYGSSAKFTDALIADAAQYDADFLVTEDTRCRKRMNQFAARGKAISFAQFECQVKELTST